MKTIPITQVQKELCKLIESRETKLPIQITGEHNNAILISESDWLATQETIYLLSIPEMKVKIRQGLDTSFRDCDEESHF
jgi:antitoxin YefM